MAQKVHLLGGYRSTSGRSRGVGRLPDIIGAATLIQLLDEGSVRLELGGTPSVAMNRRILVNEGAADSPVLQALSSKPVSVTGAMGIGWMVRASHLAEFVTAGVLEPAFWRTYRLTDAGRILVRELKAAVEQAAIAGAPFPEQESLVAELLISGGLAERTFRGMSFRLIRDLGGSTYGSRSAVRGTVLNDLSSLVGGTFTV
jgi:hypothetical protein